MALTESEPNFVDPPPISPIDGSEVLAWNFNACGRCLRALTFPHRPAARQYMPEYIGEVM